MHAQPGPGLPDHEDTEQAELQAVLSRIYRLILRVVRNPADAEEVVGDVYLQVWEKACDFRSDRGCVLAWLKTLAWSRAVDRQRRGRKYAGEWKPLLPGIHIKTLRIDRERGTQTTLWRLDPGARVPPHPHSHEEECLVIEGSIVQNGIEYFPGDYLLADTGEKHATFDSPRGALFLIRGELMPDVSVLKRLG